MDSRLWGVAHFALECGNVWSYTKSIWFWIKADEIVLIDYLCLTVICFSFAGPGWIMDTEIICRKNVQLNSKYSIQKQGYDAYTMVPIGKYAKIILKLCDSAYINFINKGR